MAHILAYTSPARGHLYPLTPILLLLQTRGHHIAVRTLASEVGLMRDLGFDVAPISERVEAIRHDDWKAANTRTALAASVATFVARAQHEVPDLRAALAAEQPDAVIADVNAWGAMAVAEAWGGPWASFCPYPLPVGSRDVPPYGLGLAPARGPLGRVGIGSPHVCASPFRARRLASRHRLRRFDLPFDPEVPRVARPARGARSGFLP